MEIKQRTPSPEPLSQIFASVYQNIKGRSSTPEFPIAVKCIDKICHGFPKAPTIITARTSHGKTAFMLQCASSLAFDHKKNVMFLSLEDSKESCTEKVLCQRFKIDNFNLKRGYYEEISIEKAVNEFAEENFIIDDGYGFNFNEIAEAYEKNVFPNKRRADIIFWDYIQMMDEVRWESYNQFLRQIRLWSIKNGIPVIIGCQQNRQSVTMMKEPSNATTKGSGTIEESAEMILLLYYPYQLGIDKGKFNQGENEYEFRDLGDGDKRLVWQTYMELSISKNKTGPTSPKIPVEYYGKWYHFQDWTCSSSIVENHRLGYKKVEGGVYGF